MYNYITNCWIFPISPCPSFFLMKKLISHANIIVPTLQLLLVKNVLVDLKLLLALTIAVTRDVVTLMDNVNVILDILEEIAQLTAMLPEHAITMDIVIHMDNVNVTMDIIELIVQLIALLPEHVIVMDVVIHMDNVDVILDILDHLVYLTAVLPEHVITMDIVPLMENANVILVILDLIVQKYQKLLLGQLIGYQYHHQISIKRIRITLQK